jgi:dihydroorotate dehydrogenase
VTVNISSPNTKNLRDLQSSEKLDELLGALMSKRASLAKGGKAQAAAGESGARPRRRADRCDRGLALKHSVDGLIATNTTVSRAEIPGHKHAGELGGLSGRPLFARSTEVLHKLSAALGGKVALIGVGGIMNGADAHAKVAAGASLVQLYTGFVYRGPDLIAQARRALRR